MKKNVTEVLEISNPLDVKSIEQIWPAWAAGVREDLAKLLLIAKKYERDWDVAYADGDLSQTGRVKKTTKIDIDTLAKLGEFEKQHLEVLRERIATAERQMFEIMEPSRPTNPGDRLAYELRLQELRAELRKLSPEERLLIFASATDSLTIDALQTAPPIVVRYQKGGLAQVVPFLDVEGRSMAVLEKARAENPDAASELQAFGELAGIYQTAIDTLRRAIIEQKPTAVLAKEIPTVA